jgi:hypothetical protein
LHEDLIPPGVSDAEFDPSALVRAIFGPEPRAARNPTAIGTGTRLLPEPSTRQPRQSDEILHGGGSYAGDRLTEWNPDYETGSDDTLQYVEVFNPAVIPFKRMTALDAVDNKFRLITYTRGKTDLPVGGKQRSDEDLFWGSLPLLLNPGEDVAIPSVSPDMRVLSYEITPTTQLSFSKDGADNFFVRSDEQGARGEHRLVFLVAARATYFGAAIPTNYKVRDLAELPARPRMAPLAAVVQERAHQALSHPDLQIRPDTPLHTALDRLVAYFRSFAPQPAPAKTDNIYWDLFASRAGVCRHRSYAFMITALAAGIPTRYLANEAHAWVEVWVPEVGWLRVDLGGAARRMHVDNVGGKSMHRPRNDDAFPKPPAYSRNYTQLQGSISGLDPQQLAEAHRRIGDEQGEDKGTRSARISKLAQDAGVGSETEATALRPGEQIDHSEGVTSWSGSGRTLDQISAEELAGKTATRIEVHSASPVGFRGETIAVTGMVMDSQRRGIEGLPVHIWLAPAGKKGANSVLIGRTASVSGGVFAAELSLPLDLPLIEHEVFATTTGDQRYGPSQSD